MIFWAFWLKTWRFISQKYSKFDLTNEAVSFKADISTNYSHTEILVNERVKPQKNI